MSHAHCRFDFNIAAWQASSNKIATPEQWRQWARDPDFVENLPEYKPPLAFLPAMQRRRLSQAARLVCDASWNLAENHPNSPLVFASHDGELNRSFELWLELMKTHTVSPTSFGLSVHNALAGQWSMLRQNMHESTALAVGDDGIESALAEACALLADGSESVLLVIADDPLSLEYGVKAVRAPFAYALAMVITQGHDYTLSMHAGNRPSETANTQAYWGGLEWIRFMLSDGLQQYRHYSRHTWHWQKNHAAP
ncbi:beta-ketoacyl synthase chain length factor [Neisseria sp. CCUG12390]|uniref:beta-ketoacyl synthase chain length factor n=1 Tax=Neisseria sp. CCUG12390 TaxID=3392035 RepID=UPI003A0FFB8E